MTEIKIPTQLVQPISKLVSVYRKESGGPLYASIHTNDEAYKLAKRFSSKGWTKDVRRDVFVNAEFSDRLFISETKILHSTNGSYSKKFYDFLETFIDKIPYDLIDRRKNDRIVAEAMIGKFDMYNCDDQLSKRGPKMMTTYIKQNFNKISFNRNIDRSTFSSLKQHFIKKSTDLVTIKMKVVDIMSPTFQTIIFNIDPVTKNIIDAETNTEKFYALDVFESNPDTYDQRSFLFEMNHVDVTDEMKMMVSSVLNGENMGTIRYPVMSLIEETKNMDTNSKFEYVFTEETPLFDKSRHVLRTISVRSNDRNVKNGLFFVGSAAQEMIVF